MSYVVEESEAFSAWLAGLRDATARRAISARLTRLRAGNWGDAHAVGSDLRELRIHHGPGWRVYVTERAGRLIIVLAGGTKRRQDADISAAQAAVARLR